MSDPRPGADYIKTIREQRAEIERLQKRNALLEDVAVAADRYINEPIGEVSRDDAVGALDDALDKLREVGDDTD